MGQVEPRQGERVGAYEIVRPVGAGQTARVYEARDAAGTSVAIKLLAADEPIDGAALRPRFRREIEVLRGIDHPNVIRLLDSGIDDAHGPFLVTPLVEGDTLRALVPMCPEAALLVLAKLAAGVAALHQVDLVHRDLKPENAMLTRDGQVLLIDLGLALSPAQTRYTAEGAVVGSVPYMSPEQIEGGALSQASDVWSLGVMAYELVAGVRPFQRARPSEEVAAVLGGIAPPLGDVDRRASPEYLAMVDTCLARTPSARPTDAAAVEALVRAQLDWCRPANVDAELRALAANPAGYQARIAPARVAAVAAAARAALDRGEPFAATRAIDRGLAYAPDSPVLTSLADQAVSGKPAKRSRTTRWLGGAAIAGAIAIAAFAVTGSDTATDPVTPTATAPANVTVTAPDAAPVIITDAAPLVPVTYVVRETRPGPPPPNPTGSRIVDIPDAGPWNGTWQQGRYLLIDPFK